MAFKIHILGTTPLEVNDRMDAMYHLGAKYGAAVYNQAVQEGYIIFTKDYVKVLPFKVNEIEPKTNGLLGKFELSPVDEVKG
jgi:hypothetical protein